MAARPGRVAKTCISERALWQACGRMALRGEDERRGAIHESIGDEEGNGCEQWWGVRSRDLVSSLALSIHLVAGAIPWWPLPSSNCSFLWHLTLKDSPHPGAEPTSLSPAASSTSHHHLCLQLKHHRPPTLSDP